MANLFQHQEPPGAGTPPLPRFAGFELLGPACYGGMGEVLLARRIGENTLLALKRLSPELAGTPEQRRLFIQEMAIANRLKHPHVVPVLEAGFSDEQLWLSMPWIGGGDLRALRIACGPAPLPAVLHVLRAVAQALDYLHQLEPPLIHADISPGNILADRDGHIWLADFGVARALGAAGKIRGKAGYLAPELSSGGRPTPGMDIYALGAVAVELIAPDSSPGEGSAGQRLEVIRDRFPGICALLEKMLDADPARRLPDGAAVLRELDLSPRASSGLFEAGRQEFLEWSAPWRARHPAPAPPPEQAESAAGRKMESASNTGAWTWGWIAAAALATGVLWLELWLNPFPPP
ncbi:MAG: Serine/threonine-protein kinase PknD [Myxococcota bacterium]|nr:Serine/threonine-protein kinase PknD [Myxococcota bacterium]